MDFQSKIDKLLEIKGVKLWKLAEESGLGSTLEKAYADNREMSDRKSEQFLQNLRINKEWWERQEGPIFKAEPADDAPAPEWIHSDSKTKEAVFSVLREALEEGSEYRILPKTVLDGEYRIVAKSELDLKDKELQQRIKEYEDRKQEHQITIDSLNKVIKVYEDEIKRLTSLIGTAPQNTQQDLNLGNTP